MVHRRWQSWENAGDWAGCTGVLEQDLQDSDGFSGCVLMGGESEPPHRGSWRCRAQSLSGVR